MRQLLAIFLFFAACLAAEESPIEKAFKKYSEAERGTTPDARKKAFNEALTYYLQAEPDHPSGPLCLNIANTYFQLGEYGFAILYYYKAQAEMPRDSQVQANLRMALQKAGIDVQEPSFVEKYLLFFHTRLSHNEKAWGALILFFIAFAIISVHIWLPQEYLKKFAIFCTAIGAIIFTSLVWVDYFSSPQVVMVHPTELRRDAGEQYATVPCSSCVPGVKLTVIGVDQQGNWMKVMLPTGEVGYIAKEYVRPL
jgi:hypothetical protein